jgi:hypothetical protein
MLRLSWCNLTHTLHVTLGDPLMIMAIQALALRSAACSTMVPLESICSQFLLLGSQYEKSTSSGK